MTEPASKKGMESLEIDKGQGGGDSDVSDYEFPPIGDEALDMMYGTKEEVSCMLQSITMILTITVLVSISHYLWTCRSAGFGERGCHSRIRGSHHRIHQGPNP